MKAKIEELTSVIRSFLNPNNNAIGNVPFWLESKARVAISSMPDECLPAGPGWAGVDSIPVSQIADAASLAVIQSVATPEVCDEFIRVESFHERERGSVDGAQFYLIPVAMINTYLFEGHSTKDAVGLAFTKVTGRDRGHILNYSMDDIVDKNGHPIEAGEKEAMKPC